MPLPVGDRTFAELHSAGLQHGAQYVIQVHATNQAGMTSSFFSRPITVDTTPPVCVAPKILAASNRSTDVVAYSCAQGGDCGRGYYGTFMWVGPRVSGLAVIAQGGMCSDTESGISVVEIGVARRSRLAHGEPAVAALRSVVPPTEHVVSFDAPLEAGMNHFLVARCANGAGVTSFCDAPMFVVDGTPPECAYYRARTLGEGHMPWAHANAGRLTVDFNQGLWDEHTGMQWMRYSLEVADTEFSGWNQPPPGKRGAWPPEQLTPLPWLEHQGRAPTEMMIYNLNMTHARWHRVLAEGVNGVGLVAEWCPSPWVLVDLTPPTAGRAIIVRTSDEAFSENPSDALFQWRTDFVYMTLRDFVDEESGMFAFQISLIGADGWPISLEQQVQHSSLVQFPVSLRHLQSFRVKIRAQNYAGLERTVISGTQVVTDATPPVVTHVSDFGLGEYELDLVKGPDLDWVVLWEVYDEESGVEDLKVCLGTYFGQCDAMQPLSVDPMQRRATFPLTGLLDGLWYYATITATNAGGGYTRSTSDGFLLDSAPPICGRTFDGDSVDAVWVGPAMQLPVSWAGHFDATSGIVRYTAVIVEVGGSASLALSPRTDAGLASVAWVDVPGLAHLKQYHSIVRVRDAVGFETDCQSDGFLTDFTPPGAGTVVSLLKTAANVPNVQTLSHVLHLGWDGFVEPESGIQQMLVALGTEADPTVIRGFQTVGTGREAVMTALQLPEGDVRVTVRASNRAGLYAQGNVTITVDSTPPECSDLTVATPDAGYFYHDADGNLFTQSAQALVVDFNCFDASPGRLERVEWAVGTEPGGSDMLPWAETTATGSRVQNISLPSGSQAYYVTVTAMD